MPLFPILWRNTKLYFRKLHCRWPVDNYGGRRRCKYRRKPSETIVIHNIHIFHVYEKCGYFTFSFLDFASYSQVHPHFPHYPQFPQTQYLQGFSAIWLFLFPHSYDIMHLLKIWNAQSRPAFVRFDVAVKVLNGYVLVNNRRNRWDYELSEDLPG